MPSAYYALVVATDAAAHEIDTLIAIYAPSVQSKALSLSRVAHNDKIAFEGSVL